jgi:hypothetical protein
MNTTSEHTKIFENLNAAKKNPYTESKLIKALLSRHLDILNIVELCDHKLMDSGIVIALVRNPKDSQSVGLLVTEYGCWERERDIYGSHWENGCDEDCPGIEFAIGRAVNSISLDVFVEDLVSSVCYGSPERLREYLLGHDSYREGSEQALEKLLETKM